MRTYDLKQIVTDLVVTKANRIADDLREVVRVGNKVAAQFTGCAQESNQPAGGSVMIEQFAEALRGVLCKFSKDVEG